MSVLVATLFAVLICMAVYVRYVETRVFRTTRVRMRSPRDFGGKLEILHLSDLHFRRGDEAKLDFLRSLHEKPVDMVVVTGDIIEDNSGIEYILEALQGFKTNIGIFAVFGAHDHWDTLPWNVVRDLTTGVHHKGPPNDFERLKQEMENIGIVCLQNEATRVTLEKVDGETELWLAGVDDIFVGLDDFDKALTAVPKDAFRILLTHTVESPEKLAAMRFDAVFAGHSHGGQVRLPFFGPIITRSSLRRKYASGLFEVEGTPFHINNGLGGGKWTNFRFLCPPEVTYIELVGYGSGGEPT